MRISRFMLGCLCLLLTACGESPQAEADKPTQVSSLLGSPAVAGYARATEPRTLVFPADHGPHSDYRSEWWYWTGNLTTADGRAFGYQFTVFRFALAPLLPTTLARPSAWAARDTWLAHLTLSDIAGGRFHAYERAGRGALDLAGATAEPFRVHCDGWEVSGSPVRLRAAVEGVALDLMLAEGKPIVLQGDQGLSRKGAEPGNASFYYSRTRMPTSGTLRLDGTEFAVSGTSWMDREWSTSALAPGVVGWDWFALQLADGRDLMFYRLRRADGSATPFSCGSLIAGDGSVTQLSAAEVTITPQGTWTSRTGVVYPAGWHLVAKDLDLTITPALADQELNLTVRYWEGAVTIAGSTTGVGYVELAGYP